MNLVYTIINLIVLFLLLRHFLIKPVSDIMEKRRQMIADGLQSAQDAQSDAQKMKRERSLNQLRLLRRHAQRLRQSMTAS